MNPKIDISRLNSVALAAWSLITIAAATAEPSESPLSPHQELVTFHFADSNLTADLIVSEPDVVSPVCVAWDADGRMFVAEMSDYPLGPAGGRIRMLEDRDGDGRYERATVFADKLSFPASVLPCRDGVLAAAAPDIWFLRDTDRDGRADERHVLFTGFGEGNQQLRVNGLTWGLDNWVYGANGRSDGEVHGVELFAGSDWAVLGPMFRQTNSLRGHDFRFRPGTGEFEAIAGRSQFGTTFDDWGNRFLSWNTMPFRHVVVETRYLDRVAQLGGDESSQNLQPRGDDGRVFPLTPEPQVFNNESQTHFNASAGTTVYRGDALGKKYQGNIFVGETLRNLVHRRILVPNGATFEARRGEEGEEFLASTDPWFHPVNFATGPDGALYVVDFYRRFVEHPGYVPEEMRNKVNWRIGAERGRIWRIHSKNWKPAGPRPNLSRSKSSELVKHLSDANPWWRVTAQRLIVERQDKTIVPALQGMARKSSSALGRLHALYALDGLHALSPTSLLRALNDPDPGIRENAVRLCEPLLMQKTSTGGRDRPGKLIHSLVALTEDADPQVRLQLALVAGELPNDGAKSILLSLIEAGIDDRWQSLAILSSAGPHPWAFWDGIARLRPDWLREPTEAQADFLDKLASLVGDSGNDGDLNEAVSWIATNRDKPFGSLALLCGLSDGARSNPIFRQHLDSALAQISAGLSKQAETVAAAPDSPLPLKLVSIRTLGKLRPSNSSSILRGLLKPELPEQVRSGATKALVELNQPQAARSVFTDWNGLGAATRRQFVAAATRSSAFADALLEALEKGTVQLTEVDPSTRQALQRNSDAELRQRAGKLFEGVLSTDREQVVRKFQPALQLSGNRARGAAIFARTCLQCHAMQERGNAIGPNIYSVASQPREGLLVSVLNPSRQVTPDYISYTVNMTDGETLTGLIAGESANGVTLRRPNAPDVTISRDRLKELKADGKSLMPEGLEQGLTQQDVADLLEFIRQPDDKLLPPDK